MQPGRSYAPEKLLNKYNEDLEGSATILFPVNVTVSRFGEEWGKKERGYNLPDRKKEPAPLFTGHICRKTGLCSPRMPKGSFRSGE
jgi:hypothetical protein